MHIDQMVEASAIRDAGDIFYLSKKDILSLKRWAGKSADNLLQAIEKSKKTTLSRFIYALGIRGVGSTWPRFWRASSINRVFG